MAAYLLLLASTCLSVPSTEFLETETQYQFVSGRDTPCVACCACAFHHRDKTDQCYWHRCPQAGTGTFCWEDNLEELIIHTVKKGEKIPFFNKTATQWTVGPDEEKERQAETYYKCSDMGNKMPLYQGKYPGCTHDLCLYEPNEAYPVLSSNLGSKGGQGGTSIFKGAYKEESADSKNQKVHDPKFARVPRPVHPSLKASAIDNDLVKKGHQVYEFNYNN